MKATKATMLLAGLAASALAITGCGSSGSGESDEPIPIGVLADLSGATGDVGSVFNEGMLAYVDNLNANGGINDRQLEAMSNDYAYEIPKAEELYRKYVNDESVAIQGWGTGDTEALRTRVANDELPFMSGSFAEELTDPEESPFNFVVAATYSDQARIGMNWISEDAGDKTTVAILHNDSPFGTAPVQDAKDWVKEKGLDIDVTSYAMPAGTTNYSGMLSQVDADGADYIMVQNVASPAAQLAKDLADSSGDQKIVCLNWCGNELFVTAAGEAAEGHMMVQPIAPLSADKPGHKEIVDYLEANGGDPKTTANSYVQGWYTMHAMAEGIRATLDSDNELTGANIREALETMGPIDTGEVFGLGEIEFSADSHRGSNSAGMYTVEDGKMVEVEGGLTP